jgi:hypothetical protein
LLMLKVLATAIVAYTVAQLVQNRVNRAVHVHDGSVPGHVTEALVIMSVSAVVLWRLVLRPLRANNERANVEVADREAALRRDATGQVFRARLHRALEMSASEAGTLLGRGPGLKRWSSRTTTWGSCWPTPARPI